MREKDAILCTFAIILAALAMLLSSGVSVARAHDTTERILSFDSHIAVNPDGSVEARETISVRAAGDQMKRGIFRDFPTRYKDKMGNQYVVSFEVLEIQRDGKAESFHVERQMNGKRIYVGEKNVLLKPGEHTYTLLYRTTRQLGFFADHDELYWNVTGNGWAFPIDRATATVTLPKGIARLALLLDGYTGPPGSLGRAFEASVEAEGRPTFITTKPLAPGEGLTIVVSWPKGFVAEPTREMKLRWFLENNQSTLVGLAGLVALLGYYLIVGVRVGKDPAAGVIMPLYEPPPDFSPAVVRYLVKMGFDHKTFAAVIVDMAVKKYLTIAEKDGVYTLTRIRTDQYGLAPEEKVIADKLFGAASKIELKTANHAKIGGALEAFKSRLRLNLEKTYFFTNQKYLIPGLLFSLLVLVLVCISAPGEQKVLAGFISIWLTGWSVAVFFLLSQVVQAWKNVRAGEGHKVAATGGAVFITLFSLPILGGEIAGLVVLAIATSIAVLLILLAMALASFMFHHLLKAPTHMGRRFLDKIEGFKMFLAAVEKDRKNLLNPPSKTPQLFERFLPYALALDVEQQWSEQFSEVLAQAGTRETTYSPAWYSGTSWSDLGAGTFASSLGSSFSSAISSSSTAPGSSSGGGGGW